MGKRPSSFGALRRRDEQIEIHVVVPMSHLDEFLDLWRANPLGHRTPLALVQRGAARSVTRGDQDAEVTPGAHALDFGQPEHPYDGGHRVLELWWREGYDHLRSPDSAVSRPPSRSSSIFRVLFSAWCLSSSFSMSLIEAIASGTK